MIHESFYSLSHRARDKPLSPTASWRINPNVAWYLP